MAYNILGALLNERGDFERAIQYCNKALTIQNNADNADNANFFKVNFRYLLSTNLEDQSIYSHTAAAGTSQAAIGILKDRLKGGIDIRIDRVENISAKFHKSFIENLKSKTRSELFYLCFQAILGATFLFALFNH